MSSVLAEIQAGYEARAACLAQAPVRPQEPPTYHFATRTYTGQALARREAWGRAQGAIIAAHRQKRLAERGDAYT